MNITNVHKINIDLLRYNGTPNLKRLERVLAVNIIDSLNSLIKCHLDRINKYKFISEEVNDNLYLYLKKSSSSKKILCLKIENGLLLNSKSETILGFSTYHRRARCLDSFDINCPKLMKSLIEPFNTHSLINKLAKSDMSKIKKYQKANKTLVPKSFLSKLDILTTSNRIEVYTSTHTRTYDQKNKNSIDIEALITWYDIYKPIQKLNGVIRYKLSKYITDIMLPKYVTTLEKNKLLYRTASIMRIEHSKLLNIPIEYRERYFEIFMKYPAAHTLIARFEEFYEFDVQKLIINDAHPKLIKELIVSFYHHVSPILLVKDIITKVLRLGMKNITSRLRNSTDRDGRSIYALIHNCAFSSQIDLLLLTTLSGLPQRAYLDNLQDNREHLIIHNEMFIKLFGFLSTLGIEEQKLKLTICRNSLNSSKINYPKLLANINNVINELYRGDYNDLVELPPIIIAKIIERNIISNKLLIQIHDVIVSCRSRISIELKSLYYPTEFIAHAENKLFQIIEFNDFVFEYLTTSEELRNEGSFMNHCVSSYYLSNINSNLFIFAVYPKNTARFNKSKQRSTFAMRISLQKNNKVNCTINQNLSFYNKDAEKDNYDECINFLSYVNKQYKSHIVNYLTTSNYLHANLDNLKITNKQNNQIIRTSIIEQTINHINSL